MNKHATPQLAAWIQDADEFGLPKDVQKGLIFLVAWYLRVNGPQETPEEWIRYTRRLSDKISLSRPHIKEDSGAVFNDKAVEELLAEFTYRLMPDFEPRVARTETGEFCVWKKPTEQRLPECLGPETYLLRDFEEIYTSLCAQIGKHLEGEDLEACYLAGFIFFDAYFPFDAQGTLQIARLLSMFFPPHFQWLCLCLKVPADEIPLSNPIQKVLNCFLDSSEGDLYRLAIFLSDTLHYSGPGQKNEAVWRATLPEYAVLAGSTQIDMDQFVGEEWFGALREKCLEKDFELPPSCQSNEEIGECIRATVARKWGYDIRRGYAALKPGEQWTRRACITFTCTLNAILRPEWNRPARHQS
jgi:hypothetical protein